MGVIRQSKDKPEPVTNPFMKKDVPILSQELQDAASINLKEAIDKRASENKPKKGSRVNTLAVRG